MKKPATSSAQKRYRVSLLETLHYTVDVLAKDEDEARDIALEDETPRSEAECTFFDAEEIALVPEDDRTFSPNNGCHRCGQRMEDEHYPHCPQCIEAIKKEKQVTSTDHGHAA
jgi:hypothetical protein